MKLKDNELSPEATRLVWEAVEMFLAQGIHLPDGEAQESEVRAWMGDEPP